MLLKSVTLLLFHYEHLHTHFYIHLIHNNLSLKKIHNLVALLNKIYHLSRTEIQPKNIGFGLKPFRSIGIGNLSRTHKNVYGATETDILIYS